MKINKNDELDFIIIKSEIISFLDSHQYMSFATSYKNRVTVRTVTYANDGLNLYFTSFKNHIKCSQIKNNSKAASCIESLQIEGKARLLGHPLDKKNKDHLNYLKIKFRNYLTTKLLFLIWF